MVATGLKTEYETDPNNVPPFTAGYLDDGEKSPFAPRFTWRADVTTRGSSQSAYRILVASARDVLSVDVGDVWDSGKVDSSVSTAVEYGGPFLDPDETYHWKVRVWDDGEPGEWSGPAQFTTAIPDTPDHWEGEWITNQPPSGPTHLPSSSESGSEVKTRREPSPRLRNEISLDKPVKRARAHVVALGYGELYVNGERIGDDRLSPGWTDYGERLLYTTHDVEEHLTAGENAIGIWLGRGWFSKTATVPYGQLLTDAGVEQAPGDFMPPQYPTEPLVSSWDAYGPPRALLQLNVEYEDGTSDSIVTETSWMATSEAAPGPLLENDIWDGEKYDARLEQPGWTEVDFDDAGWIPAVEALPPSQSESVGVNAVGGEVTGSDVTEREPSEKRPQRVQPIEVTETLEPQSIREHEGDYVVDFGQNFAGWIELTVRDPDEGDEIVLEHAEALDEDGNLERADLRTADARNTYVARGDDEETYEPRFTYQGFRYAKVRGYPGDLSAEDLVGKAVHTAFETTGQFSCSNGDLNDVQDAVVWGLRSNSHSLPTDCPQRDERVGWGSPAVCPATDLLNFDAVRFYEKWMDDFTVNQAPDGHQSDTVPWVYGSRNGDANWPILFVLIPWYLYRHTGDERVLEDRYEGMRAYVDAWHELANGHILSQAGYGDWLAFEETDPALLATSAHYRTTNIVAEAAALLGHESDAETYRERTAAIAETFNDEFFDRDENVYGSGTQTAFALPLFLEIVPDDREHAVVENLVEKIWTEDDGTIQAGLVGVRPLLFALVDRGYEEVAYNIVSQPKKPGWVYMVREGATTLWEHWDSDEEVGSGMNSLNHRIWQHVSEWFFRALAGINVEEPGFKRVTIDPIVPDELNWADGSFDTVRGEVASRWERTDSGLSLDVTIPWNATAKVHVPDLGNESVRLRESGRLVWNGNSATGTLPPGVNSVSRTDEAVVVEVGAGEYRFDLAA